MPKKSLKEMMEVANGESNAASIQIVKETKMENMNPVIVIKSVNARIGENMFEAVTFNFGDNPEGLPQNIKHQANVRHTATALAALATGLYSYFELGLYLTKPIEAVVGNAMVEEVGYLTENGPDQFMGMDLPKANPGEVICLEKRFGKFYSSWTITHEDAREADIALEHSEFTKSNQLLDDFQQKRKDSLARKSNYWGKHTMADIVQLCIAQNQALRLSLGPKTGHYVLTVLDSFWNMETQSARPAEEVQKRNSDALYNKRQNGRLDRSIGQQLAAVKFTPEEKRPELATGLVLPKRGGGQLTIEDLRPGMYLKVWSGDTCFSQKKFVTQNQDATAAMVAALVKAGLEVEVFVQ